MHLRTIERRLALSFAVCALALAGCPSTPSARRDTGTGTPDTGAADGSTTPDSGAHDGGADTGASDMGMPVDAAMAIDMGSPVDAAMAIDMGSPVDAAMPIDMGVDAGRDAGMDAGTDAGRDAGTDAGRDAAMVDAGSDAGPVDAGPCMLTHLVISEVRSRGAGGAADEYVELYNPTGAAITLDNTWTLEARSNAAASYTARWTGTGTSIPPHGHYLIASAGYTQMPTADGALSSGITDAGSLRLQHAGATVDALCYAYTAASGAVFSTDTTYTCEGMFAMNPHNNATSTNTDASIERLPGGAAGSCTDTGVSAADFATIMPGAPQSTVSPATP
jgi:hypothetical protein